MKWKFEIDNDVLETPREVTHYSGKDLKLAWTREDERRYDFKVEIDEITFLKEDFKYYRELELSDTRCDLQTLNVYLVCGGFENLKYTGTFSMSDGKWDLDKCTVKFKIKTLDPYTCIKDNDDDVNIFDFGLAPRTVYLGQEIGIESFVCYISGGGTPECIDGLPPPYGLTFEGPTWTFVKEQRVDIIKKGHLYIRNYLITDCETIPSSEWYLVEDCTSGYRKYASKIQGDVTKMADLDSQGEVTIFQQPIETIDNGMVLKDVMQNLLDVACPGYTIVSDFFQWNPKNITDINYVTQELNLYTNIIIFQKSDVKRPNTSNNATRAETNFNDLLEDILKTFNMGYKIVESDFIIEHISFFESDFGMNLLHVDPKMKFLKGTRKYSYDANKLPKYEKFKFMESGAVDFIGKDIVYDSNCVNNDDENKSDNNVENITTDLLYVLQNPDSDSSKVSDDGFVLVACDSENNVIKTAGVLTEAIVPNNVLSWAYLHDKLWRHGRVLKNGILNNAETVFETVVPTIKQDKFGLVLSCSNIIDFDPLEKIKSTLGWGFVQSAELTLSKCTMSFEIIIENLELGNIIEELGDFDEDFSEEFD